MACACSDVVIFHILPLFFASVHHFHTEKTVDRERKTKLPFDTITSGYGVGQKEILHGKTDVDRIRCFCLNQSFEWIP